MKQHRRKPKPMPPIIAGRKKKREKKEKKKKRDKGKPMRLVFGETRKVNFDLESDGVWLNF